MRLIKTDGSEIPLAGEGPDGAVTLEQLQRAVGGYIERVPGALLAPGGGSHA